jgi:hypothetical protein
MEDLNPAARAEAQRLIDEGVPPDMAIHMAAAFAVDEVHTNPNNPPQLAHSSDTPAIETSDDDEASHLESLLMPVRRVRRAAAIAAARSLAAPAHVDDDAAFHAAAALAFAVGEDAALWGAGGVPPAPPPGVLTREASWGHIDDDVTAVPPELAPEQAQWVEAATLAELLTRVPIGRISVKSHEVFVPPAPPGGGAPRAATAAVSPNVAVDHTVVVATCGGFSCAINLLGFAELGSPPGSPARWDVADVLPASAAHTVSHADFRTAPHGTAAAMLACLLARLACIPREGQRHALFAERVDRSHVATTRVLGTAVVRDAGQGASLAAATAVLAAMERRGCFAAWEGVALSDGEAVKRATAASVLAAVTYAASAACNHCYVCGRLQAVPGSAPRTCDNDACSAAEIAHLPYMDLYSEVAAKGREVAVRRASLRPFSLRRHHAPLPSPLPPAGAHARLCRCSLQ